MNNSINTSLKTKLSIYGLISAFSFIYLLLPILPGISVLIFTLIQCVSIYFVTKDRNEVKNKKGILVMIPIFILTLNYFISGSYLFKTTNFFVIIVLYSVMILAMTKKLPINRNNFEFIFKIIAKMFEPFTNFSLPIKWYIVSEGKEVQKYIIKRILIGILITIPCIIFLLIMLSSADVIFSIKMFSISDWIFKIVNFSYLIKLIYGVFVGLYLFGLLYTVFEEKQLVRKHEGINSLNNSYVKRKVQGDLIVINILLFSILIVYTMFIIIQFKYLFAGGELPNGLNYSDYARRGFFELVILSILNFGLILIVIYLLKEKIYVEKNKWSQITKISMLYLCFVTLIMLISSFYRMNLYDNEYGFTRLRILVNLFLLFESIGLIATFKYILKPNFNIIASYALIGLLYYLTLNSIQIDNIIAKRNIDMYLNGQTETIDINYLMNLSIDAAPQIYRLIDNKNVDILTKNKAKIYFENMNIKYSNNELNWQSYNLSIDKARKLMVNK